MQKSYDSLKDNDIEVILLAYLLKHPELLDTHFEQISFNLFANPENLKIFKVLEDFHQSQKNISIDTIKNYIPDIQSQTLKDLSLQIDQIVFSKEIFLNYIESLQELYLRRELFKLTQDKNNESTTFQTSNNIKEIFLDLEKKIFDLSNFKKENYEFKDFATVTKSSLQLVEKAFKKKGKYSGVVSGFNDLDNMLGGLQNSDLVILAGRPSMGKTALATNIAFNAAKHYSNEEEKGSVVMFSLEMSAEQIGLRILAEQSRIPSDKLRKGELNERDSAALSSTYQEIHQLNFFFDDSPNLTVSELRSKLRRYKKNYNSLLPDDFVLSEEFESIVEQIENTHDHFYITGNAGSGKSTLLAYFRSVNQKNKAVSQVNKNMVGVEAIVVSSKDITGFDKLSKEILNFSSA